MEHIENILKPLVDKGIVKDLFTISGRYDPNRAWIDAPLVDWSRRNVSQAEITRRLKGPVRRVPGARGRIVRANSLGIRNAQGGLKFALTGG